MKQKYLMSWDDNDDDNMRGWDPASEDDTHDNGALSGDGTELAIRKQLIQNHIVEAIVILPRNMFYSTDISVTLWILNNNKKARTVEQNGKIVKYRVQKSR